MKIVKKLMTFSLALLFSLTALNIYADTTNNTDTDTKTYNSNSIDNTNTLTNKVSDTTIVNKIDTLFAKDKQLNQYKLEVSSNDGDVKLSGTVDTDGQYENAVMLAESVEGVNNVNTDELKVKDSKQPLNDIYITAKVKGLLLKNKIFGDKDVQYWTINIETKNGIVHISGNVDNEKQKENIEQIVHSIDGVKSIETSGLTVK